MHGVQAVPTPCVNHRPPRPVQTGGGRGVTPLFHSALSLGGFRASLGKRPSSSRATSPLCYLPDWSSYTRRGALTASQCR